MRVAFAAVLAALAVPAHGGGLRHHLPPDNGLPPLYGGGYTPLACAATRVPRAALVPLPGITSCHVNVATRTSGAPCLGCHRVAVTCVKCTFRRVESREPESLADNEDRVAT